MMRNIAVGLIAIILLGAGVLFLISRNDYVFRFSEADLRERVDQRLPWTKRYLFIFDVTVDNPRIDLVEGSDRVAGGVDILLNITLGGGELPLGGAVDVSGSVLYQSKDGEFFLTDPEIESVRVQGVPERFSNQANEAISMALREFYRTRPIYSLQGTDASHVAARLVLKDVVVEDEHLVVTLGLRDNPRSDQ
ncbi:MAG: DUF1439 domain-containing protein [Pseudomonadota bacterium]